jgi:hypothetical protein
LLKNLYALLYFTGLKLTIISLLFPPPPPPFNPNTQIDRVTSPVQSSHASKRLKTAIPELEIDKGKGVANLSKSSKDSSKSMSSHVHLKDSCSHVISEIQPQDSIQLQVVAQDKLAKGSKECNSEKGRLNLTVNMGFNVIFLKTNFIGRMTKCSTKIHLNKMFLDNMDIILFLDNSHVLFFIVKYLINYMRMGVTR